MNLKTWSAVGLLILLCLGFFSYKVASGGKGSPANELAGAEPAAKPAQANPAQSGRNEKPSMPGKVEQATFGGGCFWCTESVFQQLKGVQSVVSGYTGGDVENPTYADVCTGTTGHAEAIQITFDPAVASYADLLEVFFATHDPTTLNRQGDDVGTQYRSAIFYHSDEQRKVAEQAKAALNKSGDLKDPAVTEITPFKVFYPAEKYHQNYYRLNSRQPYCAVVIRPKLEKFHKQFRDRLKEGE